MKISEFVQKLEWVIVAGQGNIDQEIEYAFASDLLSDVLTLEKTGVLLITGLCNLQVLRTAEMKDIRVIVIARNKKANREMIEMADEMDILLLESRNSVFQIAGELYNMGVKPLY